ncbi:hypothetical protein [Taibaiella koreensis]|uniref:hypothetical protein n=1 Tax=Taibaiella koreensis TaxID=1268548 RepID=UPI000E59FD45|nr:hypothetical protein [Taibaiella koreensis]
MNQTIALSAKNFYFDHFTDRYLDPEQFATEMKAAAGSYIFLEDRIRFINEVLRLGRRDLDARHPAIYHTEEQNRTLMESISLF